jgi:hypothetical protein
MNFPEEEKMAPEQAHAEECIENPVVTVDAQAPAQSEQPAAAVQTADPLPPEEPEKPPVQPVNTPVYTQQRYTYTPTAAPKKSNSGFWRRFLAVCIVVLVIFGCCGATAYVLGVRWQGELEQINRHNDQQITNLKKQIAALQKELANGGNSTVVIPGGTGTGELSGLTPAQATHCGRIPLWLFPARFPPAPVLLFQRTAISLPITMWLMAESRCGSLPICSWNMMRS